MIPYTGKNTDIILRTITNSGILASLPFVIVSGIAMIMWDFKLPHFKKSNSNNILIFIILGLWGIYDVFFNAFNKAGSWSQYFTSYNLHIDFSQHSIQMFLNGIQPGIAEEWLMRFAVLSLLLMTFKNQKYQIALSVVTSSAMFGAIHFTNLAFQSWHATLFQAISAFSVGLLFAAIYLYTNNLIWTMNYHAAFDAISVIVSGSFKMIAPTTFELQATILQMVIYVGITIFLLTGDRLKIIKQNFATSTLITE